MNHIIHRLYGVIYDNHNMHHGKKVLLAFGIVGAWASYVSYKWYKCTREWGRSNSGIRLMGEKNISRRDIIRLALSQYPPENEPITEMLEPEDIRNGAKRLADLCASYKKYIAQDVASRVLEVGCYVGRTSFELCTYFDEVTALDDNKQLISICNQLLNNREYELTISDISLYSGDAITLRRPELRSKQCVQFLHSRVTDHHCDGVSRMYGLVVLTAAHVDATFPARLTHCATHLVAVGGCILIVTPHTWYMPDQQRHSGIPMKVKLTELLSPRYIVKEETDLPLVIRETSRIFSYIVNHVSVWRRMTL